MKRDKCIDGPAGQIRPETMITAKIKLGEAVDEGFQELI